MTPVVDPTRRAELALHRAGARYVIGADEVGRGAIAGPVAVGVAVVEHRMRSAPAGLRDSKLLSEKRREALHPLVERWAIHSAVGLATAAEIDEVGIIRALGLAGARAIARLDPLVLAEAVVLLDGNHDYLSAALEPRLPVHTRIKADQDCTAVAAASVLAKVHRDRLMIAAHADAPVYGWSANKGYAAAAHYAAIAEHGPHALHRATWLHPRSAEQLAFDLGLDDEAV
ncbi:ribonuclease HII [Galbitalea sp. SE-J8]|uniref:ribonuclease HII n=1 Tax=Galbitalea sp. SE-J8 TaxID=3054952 RepID=UPI00259D1AAA|nr:ribonuclease HII [Galbitalea sp. SE-J8]MDM4762902.1 ribonuclease HII [Galbitalea sp. SE-J8]